MTAYLLYLTETATVIGQVSAPNNKLYVYLGTIEVDSAYELMGYLDWMQVAVDASLLQFIHKSHKLIPKKEIN